MNTPTPETNEFASAREAPTENCWYHFARKLERQRDAAREDAERLAQAVKALQIYADDGEGGNYAAKALAAHDKCETVNCLNWME